MSSRSRRNAIQFIMADGELVEGVNKVRAAVFLTLLPIFILAVITGLRWMAFSFGLYLVAKGLV